MPENDRGERKRPDPDALLALADKERRGKLTVFLGAAPGVGKTYAMLMRARLQKEQGGDIVIGLVETHGRDETARLLEGLEVLPRNMIEYRGQPIEEFDLDGALARHPSVIVVDELAHSNPESCRHPKRYQDIEELIDAGIDVWTALNVQHLESLSDVVAGITGIQVRERVPDTILQQADEVLLVDLTPAELIQRLKDGKVYLPESARRAVDRFFRPGNLTALRELALRRTADRVDDDMIAYRRQNAIEEPWAAGERLLVCVGGDDLGEKLVRAGSRLASGLNAPWTVISIERPDREDGPAESHDRLEQVFSLAEQLGAETKRVIGNDFVEEILRFARRENATQIMIGHRTRPFWRSPFAKSLPDTLARKAGGIGLFFVTAEAAPPRMRLRPVTPFNPSVALRSAAFALAATVLATIVGRIITAFIELPNVSLLFLLGVLGSAVYAGYTAAFAAALFSVMAYNFFFIDPLHTFVISRPHEVFALIAFMITAMLAGSLASRIREQAESARSRAAATQALYDFSRKLSGTANVDDVLWAAVTQLRQSIKRDAVLLLPADKELVTAAAWPPDTALAVSDKTAARWAMEKEEIAGNGSATLPSSPFQFRPLNSPHGVVGVCGFKRDGLPLDPNAENALAAILDQTAIAIDRARLSRESLDQAARLEGERFRAALLSSISHDLRTPLASITGAVTSLRQFGPKMNQESRDDLLQSIEEESERLTRFVANLLDMTRIEAGTLQAKKDWIDVGDVVRASVERARKYFPTRQIETSIAADLPLLQADSVLLGQVLFNLLDNANKYGGTEPINVYARADNDEVIISVTDMGRGIPKDDLEHIFEKFFRRGRADGRAPGTGLGLSIAKGFVEAMGGHIKAESPAIKRRGTRITMGFPIAPALPPKKDQL